MTFFRKHLALVSLALTLVLSGCALQQMTKLAEQQELTVTPSPLELHGDSVIFDVSAKLPVNMLKPNKLYTIKTYYNYGSEANFETIEFSDTEFENQKVEQPSITKNFSFAYTDEMESGKLMIKGVASNLEKTKFKETEEMEIAKGIITTSRLVRPSYNVVEVDHGYNNKEELIPTEVEFFFDKGRSNLKSTEVKGDEGQKLDAFIASKNVTRTVTITGSHSPEGLESINSELSEDRATVIKDYYFKQMKKYDYKGLADSIKFETKVIFQDWKPFLAQLDSSSLTADEKNEIKSVVKSSSSSFEETEKELSKLASYNTLVKEVYPKLRTSKTTILSVKPKKTDAEISILSKAIVSGTASIDTLSLEEFLYSATLTPLLEEKVAIFEAASKVESDESWRANINLGYAYVKQAETSPESKKKELFDKALVQFEMANKKKETAAGFNNAGACYLVAGNKEKATEAFDKAASLKGDSETAQSIKAGKGSLQIATANYSQAIPSLKNAGSISHDAMFNLGLVQLLNKDFTAAGATFENVVADDDKDALAYYAAAIVGARTSNVTELTVKIKQAIALDASLREKALKDLEFMNYWSNEEFKAAIQ